MEKITETKNEKFVRIATPRVEKVLNALEILGNCSGAGYEYTEEQVGAMFAAIAAKLAEVKTMYQPKERAAKEKPKFSF